MSLPAELNKKTEARDKSLKRIITLGSGKSLASGEGSILGQAAEKDVGGPPGAHVHSLADGGSLKIS